MGGYIEGYTCVIKTGKKINADIDAALDIARKLGHRIEMARKIESCLVTHNNVRPLILARGLTHPRAGYRNRLSPDGC